MGMHQTYLHPETLDEESSAELWDPPTSCIKRSRPWLKRLWRKEKTWVNGVISSDLSRLCFAMYSAIPCHAHSYMCCCYFSLGGRGWRQGDQGCCSEVQSQAGGGASALPDC